MFGSERVWFVVSIENATNQNMVRFVNAFQEMLIAIQLCKTKISYNAITKFNVENV